MKIVILQANTKIVTLQQNQMKIINEMQGVRKLLPYTCSGQI